MASLYVIACLLAANVVAASWPRVRPEFADILEGAEHSVVCDFGAPLAACRLRVWEDDYIDMTLDFDRGAASPAQNVTYAGNIGHVRAVARYAGAGLGAGQCGASFTGVRRGDYLLQCWGQAANGSWAAGFGLLRSIADQDDVLASTSPTPRYVVAAAGADVSLQLDADDQRALDKCSINTPAAGRLNVGLGESPPPGSRYRLDTAGMERGRCGWTLTNVQRRDAGLWRWFGWRHGSYAYQLTVVAVAAAPRGKPELRVADATALRAGSVLHATCSVPDALHPDNLTWIVAGDVVRRDDFYETADGNLATSLPWDVRPARQTLVRLLSADDVGQQLVCRVQYVDGGTETASVTLGVAQDCGRRGQPASKQLSVGGKEAGFAEFPWHVAVFQQSVYNEVVHHTAVCGGSLITPTFIISAAHCFWIAQLHRARDPALFTIAAGKHSSFWNDTEPTEQRRAVKQIRLPENFAGHRKRLESDVAVVELVSAVHVTPAVGVVCVDWTQTARHRHYATNNTLGTVPGWGLTENGTQSATLQYVELPFVPRVDCLRAVPFDFQVYVTADKLCGGYVNRITNVCTGDTGGGYVFPKRRGGRQEYFLRGVVSSQPLGELSCQAELPSTFTSIAAHAEWIHDMVVGGREDD